MLFFTRTPFNRSRDLPPSYEYPRVVETIKISNVYGVLDNRYTEHSSFSDKVGGKVFTRSKVGGKVFTRSKIVILFSPSSLIKV